MIQQAYSNTANTVGALLQIKQNKTGRKKQNCSPTCGRGWSPSSIISASSQKECIVAYKNALMERCFVHESMKKFVDRVRRDGQACRALCGAYVELLVIYGDVTGTEFGKYVSLVFELFYRADLRTMT